MITDVALRVFEEPEAASLDAVSLQYGVTSSSRASNFSKVMVGVYHGALANNCSQKQGIRPFGARLITSL